MLAPKPNVSAEWLVSAESKNLHDIRTAVYRAIFFAQSVFQGVVTPAEAQFPIDNIEGIYTQKVAELFGECFDKLGQVLFEMPAQFVNRDGGSVTKFLVEVIVDRQLMDLIRYVQRIERAGSKTDLPSEDEVAAFLAQWMEDTGEYLRRLSFLPDGAEYQSSSGKVALERWQNMLRETDMSLARGLAVVRAASASDQLLDQIEDAKRAAQRAAGQTGNLSLSQHFQLIALAESRAEKNYTVGVFVALLLTLLIGSSVVLEFAGKGESGDGEWLTTVVHLALVLPAVGAASYASRIARHHRELARWAKTASVQVDSIDAFAQQVSSVEQRDVLFMQLGRSIFGSPQRSEEVSAEHYSAVPPEVVGMVKELATKLAAIYPKP